MMEGMHKRRARVGKKAPPGGCMPGGAKVPEKLRMRAPAIDSS